MSVVALAAASFRRLARDRTALFFLVILPVMVMLVVGAVAGRATDFRVAVIDTAAGTEGQHVIAALETSDALETRAFDDEDAAITAMRRGELDAVVSIDSGFDDALAAGGQGQVVVYADQASGANRAAAEAVGAIVSDVAAQLLAARVHQSYAGGTFAVSRAATETIATSVDPITVTTRVVDSESGYLPAGFGYSAPTMLTLFVFITALAGGAAMIENRRLGIHARVLAAPVTPRQIVAGESLSYLGVAIMQSLLIVGVGAFVFGVNWGDPLAATVLVAAWALVGTGTGMLAGTLFRTAEQATAIGTTAGMAAGMLGGCMWPLEIVPAAMRTAGHFVPHAWAVDAWVTVMSQGGSVGDIGRELLVLAGFAAGLLALASFRLNQRLTA